jgi:bacillithiol biosynthesis cysteine-adding enzyme BshC
VAEPIVVTESLGGSTLSRAARAGQLPEWYRTPPRGAEWREFVDGVRASVPSRWYDDLAPAFAARGPAAERLKRSAAGKGIVVTTGQQPGMFGGPLMTFIKALAARALADVLQESTDIPVAPVFWAATDDADFDEASVVSVALGSEARVLQVTHRPPQGTPMADAPFDAAELDALAAILRQATGSAPHASYLSTALEAYSDGATVGGAYVKLLRAILEPLEIPVLDASHVAFTSAAQPVLCRAANASIALFDAVARRDKAIRDHGFTPQVDEVQDLSLVFSNVAGTKRRLTIAEAAAYAGATRDEHLSSTVLVRPVLERMILPTAAYLGGPGEVAYFAQVTAVAEALGAPLPLVLPRWSATVLEPKIQKILKSLGVEGASLADPHAVEGVVARRRMPTDAQQALAKARADLEANSSALKRACEGLTPGAVVDGLHRSMAHRLDRMERRLLAAVKRREANEMQKIATARASLFPHGVRQERKLAFIVFLARYGPALIEQMLSEARAHARSLVGGAPTMTPVSAAAPAPV